MIPGDDQMRTSFKILQNLLVVLHLFASMNFGDVIRSIIEKIYIFGSLFLALLKDTPLLLEDNLKNFLSFEHTQFYYILEKTRKNAYAHVRNCDR